MPFELSEILRTLSPEYQRTFTEGFEAGKKFAMRELRKTLKEIEGAEAFSTSTATLTTNTH